MKYRSWVLIFTLVTALLGTAFNVPAHAGGGNGTKKPTIQNYCVSTYDPSAQSASTTVGELYSGVPLPVVPYIFSGGIAIRITFATNVTDETDWSINEGAFQVLDASGNPVSSLIDREYDPKNPSVGITYNERNNIFVVPQVRLNPASKYTIEIGASLTSKNGVSAGSQQKVVFHTASDTTPPVWPGGSTLDAAGITPTALTLDWPAASDDTDVVSYAVYENGSKLGTVAGNVYSNAVTGLAAGTRYTFQVEAGDAAGNWSSALTGTVSSGKNPLDYVGAYLSTISNNASTTGDAVAGSTSVPVVPTIKIEFSENVVDDNVWSRNQQCFRLLDSAGTIIPVTVFRIPDGVNFNERRNVFLTPAGDLTPGRAYRITVSPNLTAHDLVSTLGGATSNQGVTIGFTVAGAAPVSTGPGAGLIDPSAGGTVALGSDAVLVVPAGALQGTTPLEITVEKVPTPPAGPAGFQAASDVFAFSVGGSSTYAFAGTVTITLTFNPAAIGPGQTPAVYYYDESLGRWVDVGGTVSGSTITVQMGHFTEYAVFPVKNPTVLPAKPALKDIAGDWAAAGIDKLVASGAVSGYPDGTFRPDQPVTRAEFVTILAKVLHLSPVGTKVPFQDIAGNWAADYIAAAASRGIVDGVDAYHFHPDDLITREQMAVMIVRAAHLGLTGPATSFADNDSISGWARTAVATAVHNGIMQGYPDHTFRPLGRATRAEAVTVIVAAFGK